jgi:hypothetical protein
MAPRRDGTNSKGFPQSGISTPSQAAQQDGRDFTGYHIVVDGYEHPMSMNSAMRLMMISSLHDRGVPVSAMKDLFHPRVFVRSMMDLPAEGWRPIGECRRRWL